MKAINPREVIGVLIVLRENSEISITKALDRINHSHFFSEVYLLMLVLTNKGK